MSFWIISTGIAGVVALLMVLALTRRGTTEGSAAFDVQVYRDQLKEVERDLARGVVTEADADQIRIEVSRRLLEADRAAQAHGAAAGGAPRGATYGLVALVAVVVVGGTGWLYTQLGAPGYPDLPLADRIEMAEIARENRPSQQQAEAEAALRAAPAPQRDDAYLALVQQLRDAVAERPDDLSGLMLLARNEANLGRFAEAWRAQDRVVDLKGESATAQDFADLSDLMVLAAGGFVSPEAELAIRETLRRDAGNGTARYYSGLLAAQTGRPDVAFRIWRNLLETSAPDAPWVPPIRAQIPELAELAGVDYVLPATGAAPRGPSASDVEAAGDMTPEARMEMIRGMVESLSERLATEGGPPDDWARLIRAYGVLGRRDAAMAIWEEAQQVFPDPVVQLPILRAARDAGVEQ